MAPIDTGQQYTVAAIIVNYCTPCLALECVESLQGERDQISNFQIYIVDNASPDGSVAQIQDAIDTRGWSEYVTLIENATNAGFSAGNNAAMRLILGSGVAPDYIYLVNPDAVALPGAAHHLAEYMSNHPSVAVAGGAILNSERQPQVAARRFPTIWSELESAARLRPLSRLLQKKLVSMPISQTPHECDWVSGASMMIATKAIRDIGLFDEGYFLYFEEVDLCHRVKNAGYSIHHVPTSTIVHIEGASTNIKGRKRRGAYWYNSRRRYFLKTSGIIGLIAADVMWGIGRLTLKARMLARLTRQHAESDPTHFAFDLLVGDLTAILSGRIFRERQGSGTRS
ncbi:MAG: glycosyltransferase family 2 protein [Planctomycetota bacterium]